jgi:uncharacterized protein YbjT (DUF2867 family)
MRVLVVGATGFVGGQLVESLRSAGHDVVAFSRSASQSRFPDDVEIFEGDLADPASNCPVLRLARIRRRSRTSSVSARTS